MIRYFVSYVRVDSRGGFGFGSGEYALRRPVQGVGDVDLLKDEVERANRFSNVVIINWRRFEDDE